VLKRVRILGLRNNKPIRFPFPKDEFDKGFFLKSNASFTKPSILPALFTERKFFNILEN
jgi:hypothetical protein